MVRRLGEYFHERGIFVHKDMAMPVGEQDEEFKTQADRALIRGFVRQIDEKAKSGMPMEYLTLMSLELEGGLCPRCKRSWRKVEAENWWLKTFCYVPACHCYKKCERCGLSLHFGDVMGQTGDGCPECGWIWDWKRKEMRDQARKKRVDAKGRVK